MILTLTNIIAYANIVTMLDVNHLAITDIFKPLDPWALDIQTDFGTELAKFIRFGNLVVAGPFDPAEPKLNIFHADIMTRVFRAQDHLGQFAIEEADRVCSVEPELGGDYTQYPALPNDAGYFHVELGHTNAATVNIYGKSEQFGRADKLGRALTASTFRQVLSDKVTVTGE